MKHLMHVIGAFAMLCVLSACTQDTVTLNMLDVFSLWDDEAEPQETISQNIPKEDEKNLISVIAEGSDLPIYEDAMQGAVLSEAVEIDTWSQEGGGATQPARHLQGSTLKQVSKSATAGEGASWIRAALAPSPVITKDTVIVMDGEGVVSAHARSDSEEVLWTSRVARSDSALLTGGIAAADGRVYVVTGRGVIDALDEKTGKKLWKRDLGEPLRSSIRIIDHMMYVVTADSRLLALSPYNGSLLWEHQGVGDARGLFGTSIPTTLGSYVVVAYASGDFYMLDKSSGAMLWSDTLTRPRRTVATGLFSGVDANPVTDGRVVYAAATSGLFVADDARNGMRLWELPIGTRHAPWLDEDVMFMVSERSEVMAIARHRGQIGWKKPLPHEEGDAPVRTYGPFLLNRQVVTVMADGRVVRHDPITGKQKSITDLGESIASSPSFAGKSAYMITYDGDVIEVQ